MQYQDNLKFLYIFFFFFIFGLTQGQTVKKPITDTLDLPDPDPKNMSNEYEMIILDGDTVLRSKITNQVFNKHVQSLATKSRSTLKTDWMNLNWDTKVFNPYSDLKEPNWPIVVSFTGENFVLPFNGPITSRFGYRKGRSHRGIDIDLVTGDNVVAAMDGKVRFARYYSGFGNVIVIRHYNGLETVYGHLSKILVKPNTSVRAGHVIGKGGNTGRSFGSHLHFEVRYQNHTINPEYFIDFETKKNLRANSYLVDEFWADPRKHRSYRQSNIVVKKPSNFQRSPVQNTFQNPTANTSTFKREENTKQSEKQSFKRQTTTSSDLSRATAEEQTYTVKKGDTLAKIATRFDLSLNDLLAMNNISKSSVIQVGQELRIK